MSKIHFSLVSSWWRQCLTLLGVNYAYMVEYRAELILWVLAGSLPLILMGAWTKAAQEGNFGLESGQFVRYFLAVFLVRQLTIVWVIWDFEKEVVEGKLSSRLLQPLDPAWHHLAAHLSERLVRIPFTFLLVGLFFWVYPQAFWMPDGQTILWAILAIMLAFALRFVIQYTFALFAFWTERAAALEEVWFMVYLFLSGLIAPLEVFPPILREIILWTPFPYMVNFPASILAGIPVSLGKGFGVSLGWLVAFGLWNRWLWRKGLKHYSGMGA
ncbi:MAG: ABC-2 family transporter protein [Cyanobacteriota bacterium]|nr:ABC-2 family transporter protein [Cyanobacteriota bacterium]